MAGHPLIYLRRIQLLEEKFDQHPNFIHGEDFAFVNTQGTDAFFE